MDDKNAEVLNEIRDLLSEGLNEIRDLLKVVVDQNKQNNKMLDDITDIAKDISYTCDLQDSSLDDVVDRLKEIDDERLKKIEDNVDSIYDMVFNLRYS